MTNNNENKVNFKTLSSAMLLMTIVIGWILISQHNTNQRVNAVEKNNLDMRVDIGIIKTDVGWIKNSIEKNNNITFK